ncbi:MAG: diguanylate cyclase [Phycisphaeraceae bacterium]
MLFSSSHILAVDDSRTVQELLRKRLGPLCDRLTLCGTAADARRVLASEPVDVALLDVVLPDGDGYALCSEIVSGEHTRGTMVIFLSMQQDANSKVLGLHLGATDYITKPFHPDELRARVAVALRQKATADMLQHYAEADPLSGLGNRRRFDRTLPVDIQRSREAGQSISLVLADIDGFKSINDICGHPVGDRVLTTVASILTASFAPHGHACRLGGDEFAAWITGVDADEALRRAGRLCANIRSSPALLQLVGHAVTLSVGVATSSEGAPVDASSLLTAADEALYASKRAGRDRASGATPGGQSRPSSAAA